MVKAGEKIQEIWVGQVAAYDVVYNSDLGIFGEDVDVMVRAGWRPVGGMVYAEGRYIQGMIWGKR